MLMYDEFIEISNYHSVLKPNLLISNTLYSRGSMGNSLGKFKEAAHRKTLLVFPS